MYVMHKNTELDLKQKQILRNDFFIRLETLVDIYKIFQFKVKLKSVLRIRWIHNILAPSIRNLKNMRIHEFGPKRQHINKTG